MSMQVVPEFKWRLALLGLGLTLIVGAGLTWMLAQGAADPPRAPFLVLNENRSDRLTPAGTFADVRLYHFADTPIIDRLPFTIEIAAVNEGDQRSAWGVWISADGADVDNPLLLLVTDQGYVLSALDSPALQHEQFMHITAAENRLALHVDADGIMTFRVNDEVVREVEQVVGLPLDYGVALLDDVRLEVYHARIYTAYER